jgi:hypothetical protein
MPGMLALYLCLVLVASNEAAEPPREYQVKAAFIYHFAQFVEWPADAFESEHAPIIICIVGHDPFRGALDEAIRDKTVAGRRLIIRRHAALVDIPPSHIFFVSAADQQNFAEMRRQIGGHPTLTIGEHDAFSRAGGMIRLFTDENKVRFEINPKAAERARIKISARLLKLAKIHQE